MTSGVGGSQGGQLPTDRDALATTIRTRGRADLDGPVQVRLRDRPMTAPIRHGSSR